ncbi:MAG: hypothetical protein RMI91_04560 [Gemmatales bacterium]|nr:hypothetical protein [Gemmatales bacterium]MDW7993908.1 hypothetical protein [Gemmatales bacterium]
MVIARFWMVLAWALASALAAQAWERDYGKALRESRQDGKPVLVVIGRGKDGWRSLLPHEWSKEALTLVESQFHAVYVDAEDAEYGRLLAREFHLRQLPALVISDRYGRAQVVRHEGAMGEEQLLRLLRQHGNATGLLRGSVPAQETMGQGRAVVPSRLPAVLCPT